MSSFLDCFLYAVDWCNKVQQIAWEGTTECVGELQSGNILSLKSFRFSRMTLVIPLKLKPQVSSSFTYKLVLIANKKRKVNEEVSLMFRLKISRIEHQDKAFSAQLIPISMRNILSVTVILISVYETASLAISFNLIARTLIPVEILTGQSKSIEVINYEWINTSWHLFASIKMPSIFIMLYTLITFSVFVAINFDIFWSLLFVRLIGRNGESA